MLHLPENFKEIEGSGVNRWITLNTKQMADSHPLIFDILALGKLSPQENELIIVMVICDLLL